MSYSYNHIIIFPINAHPINLTACTLPVINVDTIAILLLSNHNNWSSCIYSRITMQLFPMEHTVIISEWNNWFNVVCYLIKFRCRSSMPFYLKQISTWLQITSENTSARRAHVQRLFRWFDRLHLYAFGHDLRWQDTLRLVVLFYLLYIHLLYLKLYFNIICLSMHEGAKSWNGRRNHKWICNMLERVLWPALQPSTCSLV